MATWDQDGITLAANVERVLEESRAGAIAREAPSLALARDWHKTIMKGLVVPGGQQGWIGTFRGEPFPAPTDRNVAIGRSPTDISHHCPDYSKVSDLLNTFEREFQRDIQRLDERYARGLKLDAAGVEDVIELAARAHNEWTRIHPFMNGNGRVARTWANWVLARYGLRQVLRLRPRPGQDYVGAADQGMRGRDHAMRAFIANALGQAALTPRRITPPPPTP